MAVLFSLLTAMLVAPMSVNLTKYAPKVSDASCDIDVDKVNYKVDKPFEETINTFEAWIKLPKSIKDTQVGGIIFGNFYNSSYGYNGSCDYLIDKNGNFRLYYNRTTGSTAQVDHVFEKYDFRTGNWEHIALTRTPSEFKFYVNGELNETLIASSSDNAINAMTYKIGNDWENWTKNIDGGSDRYAFLGEIASVSVFSYALSQNEIKSDLQLDVIPNRDGMMGSWYLGDWSNEEVEDSSINKNNVRKVDFEKYIQVDEVEEFDYSIMCVPDIQITTRYNPSKLDLDFDWIIENKDSKNIQYISFVGDLTDTCDYIGGVRTEGFPQWNAVTRNFAKLDSNNIAYGFVPGNHDYDDGTGRSRPATYMNQFLPYEKYSKKDYFGGAYYAGAIENYYNVKKINGIDYLFLNLEFGPRDGVLIWANRVVEEHPNHRVVISTHSYVEPDGRLSNANDTYAASRYGIGGGNSSNNADEMFDKLVKKHKNIFIVFSGHNSSDDIVYRTDKGENGNTIHSFLIDAQGSFNSQSCDVMSIFKINEGEKKAYVYWYSPYEKGYLNRQNQFVIDFADEENPTVGVARRKAKINKNNNGLIIAGVVSVFAIIPGAITLVSLNLKGGKKDEE